MVVGVMLIIFTGDLILKLCLVFYSGEQEFPVHFQDLLMKYNCRKHPYITPVMAVTHQLDLRLVCIQQWRTDGGKVDSTPPPPPKFRSFKKAEPK
jgi:hypothetical protein